MCGSKGSCSTRLARGDERSSPPLTAGVSTERAVLARVTSRWTPPALAAGGLLQSPCSLLPSHQTAWCAASAPPPSAPGKTGRSAGSPRTCRSDATRSRELGHAHRVLEPVDRAHPLRFRCSRHRLLQPAEGGQRRRGASLQGRKVAHGAHRAIDREKHCDGRGTPFRSRVGEVAGSAKLTHAARWHWLRHRERGRRWARSARGCLEAGPRHQHSRWPCGGSAGTDLASAGARAARRAPCLSAGESEKDRRAHRRRQTRC